MKRTEQKLIPFDAVRYLTDEASINEYFFVVLESGDPGHLLLALKDIALARGATSP